MSTDPAPSDERIPHLMVGREVRRIPALDPDDVDYSATTACGLDRNVTLVTSDRNQVRCSACRTAEGDAAERAAMVRLAERWETGADNLTLAIADGASRHLSEVETLRNCAHELRRTLSAQRPGAS